MTAGASTHTPAPHYVGRCLCGAVEIEVAGEPLAIGYCHCRSCRRWSASPMQPTSIWPRSAFKVTKGEAGVGVYAPSPGRAERLWCKTCGGHLGAYIGSELVDVFPPIMPDFPFKPRSHIFYGEGVMKVPDGLPKFRALPSEGPTGLLPE
jgi:hypothetical protein